MNCKKCSHKVSGNYCSQCGQALHLKRINSHFIVHEIEHVLHFERGLLFTIKELLIRPGKTVRNYLSEDRSRLVKPLMFLIIASLIYTLVEHYFKIDKGYFRMSDGKVDAVKAISEWVQSHYGYANVLMGLLIAAWVKIFFRKEDCNFFEITIFLSFFMGMAMLLLSIFGIVEGVTKINIRVASGVLSILYIVWAIGQFFGQRKIINYFKAAAAYVAGMATFSLLTMLLGLAYNAVIK